jgi:sugar (pentulose or hexulose) kinase
MATPVIAIIDVGKTNKKLFLFDEQYKIVFEQAARFNETVDEDGDPCENLESLRQSVYDSLNLVLRKKEFSIKAVNFSTYGASFVYIDERGEPVCPLYNYLKVYPEHLKKQFYDAYGGEAEFSLRTASPVLGSLNSGMQLYRIKYEKPGVFKKIKHALHLPQYLSYLVTKVPSTDITSIGCHTNLWDFEKGAYHEWVEREGLAPLFAPIRQQDEVLPAAKPYKWKSVGVGLHDSSASLIPYIVSFTEPFVLISTGTWCISLNPFNQSTLTTEELKNDCLSYLHFGGQAVKASRLFAGQEHEDGVKRIASHFEQDPVKFRSLPYQPELVSRLRLRHPHESTKAGLIPQSLFESRDISLFSDDVEAYHQLVMDIITRQVASTMLVLNDEGTKRIFVDGGFSRNAIYMNLLAAAFPKLEVYAASMAQATAMGAALSLHKSWNPGPLPQDLISLQYYSAYRKELL